MSKVRIVLRNGSDKLCVMCRYKMSDERLMRDVGVVLCECQQRDVPLNMAIAQERLSKGKRGVFKPERLMYVSESRCRELGIEPYRKSEGFSRGTARGKSARGAARLKREARMNKLSQRRAKEETAAARERMAMEEERIMSSVHDGEPKRTLRPRRVRESV